MGLLFSLFSINALKTIRGINTQKHINDTNIGGIEGLNLASYTRSILSGMGKSCHYGNVFFSEVSNSYLNKKLTPLYATQID